jgi:hypothetical protein
MGGVRVKDSILLDSVHVGVSTGIKDLKQGSIIYSFFFVICRKPVVYSIPSLVGTVVLALGLVLKDVLCTRRIVL